MPTLAYLLHIIFMSRNCVISSLEMQMCAWDLIDNKRAQQSLSHFSWVKTDT